MEFFGEQEANKDNFFQEVSGKESHKITNIFWRGKNKQGHQLVHHVLRMSLNNPSRYFSFPQFRLAMGGVLSMLAEEGLLGRF